MAKAAATSGLALAASTEKLASGSEAVCREDAHEAKKAAALCFEVDRSPKPPCANPKDAWFH